MWIHSEKPNVNWITVQKFEGGEWVHYTKNLTIPKPLRSAVIRFECDCVCGVYINGDFAACGNGRMPERVNAHEVTSRLQLGENKICLCLGSAYFQKRGFDIKKLRGYWLNMAAAELCVEYEDGTCETFATDATWTAQADGAIFATMEAMPVTDAEYARMWQNAVVWPEAQRHRPIIPQEILQVAGEEYRTYAQRETPEFVRPAALISTNFMEEDGVLVSDASAETPSFAVYDFGRLHVGFTQIVCQASADTEVTFLHDYYESPEDFNAVPLGERVDMLAVTLPVKAGAQTVLNLRRRAYRYLKVVFPTGVKIRLLDVSQRIWMFPQVKTGYFSCSDSMLNEAWEVGKYTLQVNKQQEYESCPRYEMQFFAGDGAVDAWIDEYAFGGQELMNASLSIVHEETSTGISHTDKWNRSVIQWDYFAWRIICIHLHYKATGDKAFLKRYYEEAKTNLLWQMERQNSKHLMFQRPCFASTYSYELGQTEWSCSPTRLGEKTALNALLYASLTAMAYLAEEMDEKDNAAAWRKEAEMVKNAINQYLWDEEKQCYVDALDNFVAQDANTFAIIFGIADACRANAALDTMRERLWSPYGSTILDVHVNHTRGGNITISPFMTALEAKARFENGRDEEALSLIRRCWGGMLQKGAKTFWEFTPNHQGQWKYRAHAWSAGCTWLLSAYILGIRATAPNYREVTFAPRPCDLDSICGVVPTPSGYIAASCHSFVENGSTHYAFTLAVSENVTVHLDLPENSTLKIITYKA